MNAAPEPQEDPDRAAALAVLDDPEFRADLIKLDDLQREYALSRAEWYLRARGKQMPPCHDDWHVLFICAGRGFGKTETGAQTLFGWAWELPKSRSAVVAPTFGDCQSVCFEGPSGLLNAIPASLILKYVSNKLEITLMNGSIIKGFSAEKYNKLRGPNHHFVWSDEVGSWQYPTQALEQIDFGLRLGKNPHHVITTTPIPSEAIRQLIADCANPAKRSILVTGSTFENAKNLSPEFIEKMKDKYEGTRLGRQELYAEILVDTPGALWTNALLQSTRIVNVPPLKRIAVGVDPAMSANTESDEVGIVVAGLGEDGHLYILADRTVSMAKPSVWAQAVVDAYHDFKANFVVAEVNNGGDLVADLLNRTDASVPVKAVHASVGKFARAEPISMLYEQNKAHHVGTFGKLESQMTTYVPGIAKKSPDRMDAMVWAATKLMPAFQKKGIPLPATVMKTK